MPNELSREKWSQLPDETKAKLKHLLPHGREEEALVLILQGKTLNFNKPTDLVISRVRSGFYCPTIEAAHSQRRRLIEARSIQVQRTVHDSRIDQFRRMIESNPSTIANFVRADVAVPVPSASDLASIRATLRNAKGSSTEQVPSTIVSQPFLSTNTVGTLPDVTVALTGAVLPEPVALNGAPVLQRAIGVSAAVDRPYRYRRRHLLPNAADDSDLSPSDTEPVFPDRFVGTTPAPAAITLVSQSGRVTTGTDPERFGPTSIDPSCFSVHAPHRPAADKEVKLSSRGRVLRTSTAAVPAEEEPEEEEELPLAQRVQSFRPPDTLSMEGGKKTPLLPPTSALEARLFKAGGDWKLKLPRMSHADMVERLKRLHGPEEIYRRVRRRHRHAFRRMCRTIMKSTQPPPSISIDVPVETLIEVGRTKVGDSMAHSTNKERATKSVGRPSRFLHPTPAPNAPAITNVVEAVQFILLAQTDLSASLDDITNSVRRLGTAMSRCPAEMSAHEYVMTAVHLMASPAPDGILPWTITGYEPATQFDLTASVSLGGPIPISKAPRCDVRSPLVFFDEVMRRWRYIASPTVDIATLCTYFDDLIDDTVDRGRCEVVADNKRVNHIEVPQGKTKIVVTIPTFEPEIVEQFQQQETERYSEPEKPFVYVIAGRRYIMAPLKKGRGGTGRNSLLVDTRPAQATILSIVKEAAARLPDGYGTRHDVIMLVRNSQFFMADQTGEGALAQTVGGALDRLHGEPDKFLEFDAEDRVWTYLHHNRLMADFE
ncbi:Nuclear factor related to kappa-B-binding protein, NFRKB [Carpediemonas membranifera]|uniref:Nuclear factor related to kappa-B-binding protein, NFRKB n=1 Tax=Carpediemonas membranifera TaxID=201153 RepID=A0A8J6B099_9EUKA|nr:Nuclear factor related to kappa-B-binding protein, NFRKB [Carpediemonas membranifera]|eukprot:KAG9396545.1 Nuclear factor related to kappa-B-binding protein, NFRKB [Carpediemonas membranifera]